MSVNNNNNMSFDYPAHSGHNLKFADDYYNKKKSAFTSGF